MQKQIKFFTMFLVLSFCYAGCGTFSVDVQQPEPPEQETDATQLNNMPNPASVFCEQQGYRLEIRTDATESVGYCVFLDGSECEEWAYFNGTCQPGQGIPEMENQATELPQNQPVTAWVGHIHSLPEGAQFDDYVSLMPNGAGELGITGANSEIEAEIVSLRDATGNREFVFLWGEVACDVPDYGNCQLSVDQVRYGAFQAEETVEAWEGTVVCSHFNSSPQSTCGNAFELAGVYQPQFGALSIDEVILQRLNELRDTRTLVKIWGTILIGVPDTNGSQIQVARIEIVQ